MKLQEYNHWCCHDDQKRPTHPNGNLLSINNLLYSFSQVSKYDKIGFVLRADDPFTVIDIDDCIQNKETELWASKIVKTFDTYYEISPNGHGIHIIFEGKLPNNQGGIRQGCFEIYSHHRFVTINKETLLNSKRNIEPRQAKLDELLEKFPRRSTATKSTAISQRK